MTAKKIERIERQLEKVVLEARKVAELHGMQSQEFMVLADLQMSLRIRLVRLSKPQRKLAIVT